MNAAALIPAAGSSSRMNTGRKKEYELISGKPVLAKTCEAFLETGLFAMICCVVPEGEIGIARDLLISALSFGEEEWEQNLCFAEGGETRQCSVFNGLKRLAEFSPDHVLIHDGARPWISPSLVRSVYHMTLEQGACAPVIVPPDTIKQIDASGTISTHLQRTNTVGIQTPQGFAFKEILRAHEKAAGDGMSYIDDTEIYDRYAGPVSTVPGDPVNIKITYAHDLEEVL